MSQPLSFFFVDIQIPLPPFELKTWLFVNKVGLTVSVETLRGSISIAVIVCLDFEAHLINQQPVKVSEKL